MARVVGGLRVKEDLVVERRWLFELVKCWLHLSRRWRLRLLMLRWESELSVGAVLPRIESWLRAQAVQPWVRSACWQFAEAAEVVAGVEANEELVERVVVSVKRRLLCRGS